MANSVFIGWFGGAKFTYDGSSTSVAANWLPDADNTYDLGSSSFRWKSAYLATSLIQGGALALGTTSTLGAVLQNTTAAAAGVQQISPGFDLVGQGWKTDATAASQEVRWRQEVLPVQGTSAPTSTWKLKTSVNAGAFTEILTATSAAVTSTVPVVLANDTDIQFYDNAANVRNMFGLNASNVLFINEYGFTTSLNPNGGAVTLGATSTFGWSDVSLSRGAANRLTLATGDAFNLAPTAFASLPTGSEGDLACVTDSNTATWGATIAGGGANNVLAYFNGTNWTVAGA